VKGISETSKWILVVGARPNFMKVAPLIRAILGLADIPYALVTLHHTAGFDRTSDYADRGNERPGS